MDYILTSPLNLFQESTLKPNPPDPKDFQFHLLIQLRGFVFLGFPWSVITDYPHPSQATSLHSDQFLPRPYTHYRFLRSLYFFWLLSIPFLECLTTSYHSLPTYLLYQHPFHSDLTHLCQSCPSPWDTIQILSWHCMRAHIYRYFILFFFQWVFSLSLPSSLPPLFYLPGHSLIFALSLWLIYFNVWLPLGRTVWAG